MKPAPSASTPAIPKTADESMPAVALVQALLVGAALLVSGAAILLTRRRAR